MPEENYPSIFNDVIGPVMRGPSSSHCAASVRIGRIARDLMDADIRYVMVEFDKNGSLATTHKSQGSDMGLCAGLLGWDAKDERMLDSERYIQESGIGIDYKITDIGFNHPNTYKLILRNSKRELVLIAVSTGGGSIEIIKIDEFEVSFRGDIFTTLLFSKQNIDNIISYIQTKINIDKLILHNTDNNYLLEIRTLKSPNKEQLRDITNNCPGIEVKSLNPVFPVITKSDLKVPFITSDEMLKFRDPKEFKLWEYAVKYESIRGSMSEKKVMEEMGEIVNILDQAVDIGIKGTSFSDRILGFQSGKYKTSLENKMLSGGESFNTIILYVTALMEVKSSMGIIVAAPTAGSCGGLPGAVLAVADVMGLGKEEKTKALLAAGIVGVFISARSTFAAETCGCQAECGSGSGMAAAALVSLMGGTTKQALSAASIALQNTLGMICDPVANRVEVPCLGKNIMAATNALSCTNMALASFDEVIPLDEVIETMDKVGKSIARELRCTGLGGLSITPTSLNIEKRLK